MSKFILSKKGIFTKYNGTQYLQYQDQTNSEALRTQECTHMNDIAYHVCPD